jgi:hypothetical protein
VLLASGCDLNVHVATAFFCRNGSLLDVPAPFCIQQIETDHATSPVSVKAARGDIFAVQKYAALSTPRPITTTMRAQCHRYVTFARFKTKMGTS